MKEFYFLLKSNYINPSKKYEPSYNHRRGVFEPQFPFDINVINYLVFWSITYTWVYVIDFFKWFILFWEVMKMEKKHVLIRDMSVLTWVKVYWNKRRKTCDARPPEVSENSLQAAVLTLTAEEHQSRSPWGCFWMLLLSKINISLSLNLDIFSTPTSLQLSTCTSIVSYSLCIVTFWTE